jgi:hypothetical protein
MVFRAAQWGLATASLLTCSLSAAEAGEMAKACKQSDVVQFVRDALRDEMFYVKLDEQSISEQPSRSPDVILCSVLTIRWEYDATRFQRMTWLESRSYTVKNLGRGFEVSLLR